MTSMAELAAWLRERAKPDSGIVYGDNSRGIAEVTLHGYDAAFVAENFHGKGADTLADALTSLMAERDGLASTALIEAGWQAHERELREAAETSRDAGRENFLTMQGAAATLLKRLETAEAQLKTAREALEKATSLLEVVAEDPKERGDTATWAMTDTMADAGRQALEAKP